MSNFDMPTAEILLEVVHRAADAARQEERAIIRENFAARGETEFGAWLDSRKDQA